MPIRLSSLLVLAACAAPAAAQDVIRLSPAEREAALAAAAAAPIDGAPRGADGTIHGTMGVTIGSNGTRAISGSTIVPLGANAALGLAFVDAQGGRWRAR